MKNKFAMLVIKVVLCIFLIVSLGGCLGARELNQLKIVVGLGVDKDDSKQKVILTTQIVKPSDAGKTASDGGGGGSDAFFNISGEGGSIFDAVRDIAQKIGYKMYFSHSQIIVFGKDVAMEGMQKYLDFFMRANEVRPTTLILISKDKASDILSVKPETEKLNGIHIANLVKGYGLKSQYKEININSFAETLMSNTMASVAPLIGIFYEKGKQELYISSMAVLKNSKMIGTLDPTESRGLLWVNGKVKSGGIEVFLPGDNGKVELEIIDEKTKIIPKIQDGKIMIDVEIQENSSIVEQTSAVNLNKPSICESLQNEQARVISQEVMKAFNKSKELNADFFGFGELLHKKYPTEWKSLKEKWNQKYPSIQLTVKVETKIRRTDNISRPVAPEKGVRK